VVRCFCGERAVFNLEGRPLCRKHFTEWLKGEVRKELERFVGRDVLAVAVSGGKDSTTLLEISHEWARERGIKLFGIMVDEGIEGYRDRTRAFLENFCSSRGIELHVYEFRKEFGATLDELVERRDRKGLDIQACTICGTLRRYLLNKYARELGATKILFAHNLDDEIQTFFMNLFTGNLAQASRKGELAGVIEHELFVIRFKPLIRIPEKATAVYSLLRFPELPEVECPYLKESLRYRMRRFVFELENRIPGAKRRILEVYLEKILPLLRENARKFQKPLQRCSICGEPASREICKACELRMKLL